jgi:hypothetical protein
VSLIHLCLEKIVFLCRQPFTRERKAICDGLSRVQRRKETRSGEKDTRRVFHKSGSRLFLLVLGLLFKNQENRLSVLAITRVQRIQKMHEKLESE